MLFSKLYFATFLAGAFAAPIQSDSSPVERSDSSTDGAEYSIVVYSIGKEEKRSEEAAAPVAKRGEEETDGAEYGIVVYSIGKEEK
ncbi:hypothetical protein F4781DRAFT_293010 [Annulohypoxylon bovei var. microspora]|nr:hypothetical protein F4781DRAFT_293010 [Annulohypoxylon bovei var. microspora]